MLLCILLNIYFTDNCPLFYIFRVLFRNYKLLHGDAAEPKNPAMSYTMTSNITDIPSDVQITPDNSTPRQLEVQITLTILLVIIISLAVVGNILVFLTLLRCKSLRKQISSVFLFNLAMTDIGCAILVMPFAIVSTWKEAWIFGDFWCDGVCFFNYCFIIVSMATLALISLDRYIFVVHPLRYDPLVTRHRAIMCCCFGWLVGIIFGAAPPLARWVWYDDGEIICAINWESDKSNVITYTLTAFLICFMFPMLVMCFAYLHIYKVAKKHATRIAVQSASPNRQPDRVGGGRNARTNRTNRYNTKAIKTILIMILAYAICNTPFSLTKLLKVIYSDNEVVPKGVNTLASWLAYINPCCNPIIYAINREEFRNAFYRILCLKTYDDSPFSSKNERATYNQSSVNSEGTNRIYSISSSKSSAIKMSTLYKTSDVARGEDEDRAPTRPADQPRSSVSQVTVALPGILQTPGDDQIFRDDFTEV